MIIVRQVSWSKRYWPSQSACCIITYTVHPGLDIVGNKFIIKIIGLVSWIQSCHLFSFGHYASSAWCIKRYTVYPGLVSCPFYAIPIYPFKFIIFLIYLLLIGIESNFSLLESAHAFEGDRDKRYKNRDYPTNCRWFPFHLNACSTRSHTCTKFTLYGVIKMAV